MIVHSNVLGLVVGGIAVAMLCLAQALELRRSSSRLRRVVSTIAVTLFLITTALVLNRFAALGG